MSRRRLHCRRTSSSFFPAYRLDAALDRIAFNASVIDEARQAVPMVEGVADGFAQTGLLRDFQQSRLEPGFEVLDQRPRSAFSWFESYQAASASL